MRASPGLQGPGPPLYVPLASEEIEDLCHGRIHSLPAKLLGLLRRHHAPVRSLFQQLDGNLDGSITRHELWASLQGLGVPLSLAEADVLFRALLEFAIGEGEVTLSFRAVQRALLSPEVGELIWEKDQDRRALRRAKRSAAKVAQAERRAATATQARADAACKLRLSQKRLTALRSYAEHIEHGRDELERRMLELADDNLELRTELAAARRELIERTPSSRARAQSPTSEGRAPCRASEGRAPSRSASPSRSPSPRRSPLHSDTTVDSPLQRWRAEQSRTRAPSAATAISADGITRGRRGGRAVVGAPPPAGAAVGAHDVADSPLRRWRAEQYGLRPPSSGGLRAPPAWAAAPWASGGA